MIEKAPQTNEYAHSDLVHLAKDTVLALRGLGADEQAHRGALVLQHASLTGDDERRELASRALQVMERFPHFPRPRAAVVMHALKKLAAY